MADEKISAMPAAATLDGTELVPLVQGGVNVQCALSTLLAVLLRGLATDAIVYFNGTNLATSGALQYDGEGGIRAVTFTLDTSIVLVGFGPICDALGNLTCLTVAPQNGVTGVETSFTSWTLANGIVTAAA